MDKWVKIFNISYFFIGNQFYDLRLVHRTDRASPSLPYQLYFLMYTYTLNLVNVTTGNLSLLAWLHPSRQIWIQRKCGQWSSLKKRNFC